MTAPVGYFRHIHYECVTCTDVETQKIPTLHEGKQGVAAAYSKRNLKNHGT